MMEPLFPNSDDFIMHVPVQYAPRHRATVTLITSYKTAILLNESTTYLDVSHQVELMGLMCRKPL